jgi:hypothetical protein
MKWITRERVKVDRIGCYWLIKKLIDPKAEFFFVPVADVMTKAKELGATPFDVPPHPDAKFFFRNAKCTFELLVEEFKIADPAIHRLAKIVHGADVLGEEGTTPQSAGLKAISEGFLAVAQSDQERIDRQLPIYDALYAWCQAQEK